MTDATDGGRKHTKRAVTVLVVSDCAADRHELSELLRTSGYLVATACDGFDALSVIVEQQPALVLADIVMPRLDGYQMCALIKRNPRFQHVPVMLMASSDSVFDHARGRLVGAEHLSKPLNEATLQALLENALLLRPGQQTANDKSMTSTASSADADQADFSVSVSPVP